MSKFKVGDRVEMVETDGKAVKGLKGTIRGTSSQSDYRNYGVEFDDGMDGHDLHSCVSSCPRCKNGRGWWVRESSIKLVNPKLEVGQIYRVTGDRPESGNIIKVESISGEVFYKTIRGNDDGDRSFSDDSGFANSLELLTGPQIGEAIRKWDEEHAQKSGVREVNRQANVGDYIKITDNAHCTCDCYKQGDILEVFQRKLCGVFAFTQKAHPDHSNATDKPTSWISDDEYVVLEGYKPEQKGKHVYTAEQIAKAKKLCGEMMVEAFDDNKTFAFHFYDKQNGGYKGDCEENEVKAEFRSLDGTDVEGVAKCSNHDEYNVWIGRCVALCKALHKPVPAFIMGDGKGRHFDFEKAKAKGTNPYFTGEKVVTIHCKTETEARQLLGELSHLGYRWQDGTPLLSEINFSNGNGYYNAYSSKTVTFNRGAFENVAEFSDCFTED